MALLPWRLALLLALLAVVITAVWYRSRQDAVDGHTPAEYRVVAVAPFALAAGEDPERLAFGLPRLLAARIAGNGGWRRVAPEVVAARSGAAAPSLREPAAARSLAQRLVAQAIVVGELRMTTSTVQARAAWLSAAEPEGEPVVVEASGQPGKWAELVDRLADALLQNRLAPDEVRIARVGAVTSSDPDALRAFLAGEERFFRGDYRQARLLWQEAIAADPQFALAYLRLAELHRWLGERELAVQARQNALLLSNRLPVSEREWLELELLAMRGEIRKALDGYRALLALVPNDWEGWCGLADLYRLQGEAAAAREALAQATHLLPQHQALIEGRLAFPAAGAAEAP